MLPSVAQSLSLALWSGNGKSSISLEHHSIVLDSSLRKGYITPRRSCILSGGSYRSHRESLTLTDISSLWFFPRLQSRRRLTEIPALHVNVNMVLCWWGKKNLYHLHDFKASSFQDQFWGPWLWLLGRNSIWDICLSSCPE